MADTPPAEGPVVHKRILVGGPPSDLPDDRLSYPGKPLPHRFVPTERIRRIEETRSPEQPKLATDIPFKPVASVSYPDKNIHLAPVSNVRARGLTPVALDRTATLPSSDIRVFELSQDLHQPLEARLDSRLDSVDPRRTARQARLDRLSSPPEDEPQPTPKAPSQKDVSAERPVAKPATTHTELEQLKELARQELAARPVLKIAEPAPEEVSTLPTLAAPTSTPVVPAKDVTLAAASPPATLEKSPSGTETKTKQLLADAERLEAELSKLRQGIAVKEEVATPTAVAIPTAPVVDDHAEQINQLVLDKTELLKKVSELTSAYREAAVQRQKLEDEVANLTTESERHLQEVQTEKANLADKLKSLQQQEAEWAQKQASFEKQIADEAAKRQEVGTRLQSLTTGFEGQLQKIALEKANLADKLKSLQQQEAEWAQKQASFEKQTQESSDLATRLAATVKERDDARGHLAKLETFLEDIRREPKALREPETVVKPQFVEPPKSKIPAAKIIKPQAAVGKMAPSLTSASNVVNGIVKDTDGLLLANVIIVVKDEKGEPVRALKTNKIGQFAISTPLPNGTYTMELEEPGHNFDIIQVEVKGKVLPPIEIRSNN